jgi:hypothetical protein
MSDHHTQLQDQERRAALTPVTDDGWSDAANEAAERTIRGTLLKFADWRWTAGKEAAPLKDGTRLVALATAAMWVRWEDGKPVEYRVREPGKRLPYRGELSHLDESEWEEGPNGEPIDPWRNTRLVYLVDPQTAEAFTFSTSSWGGRGAVCDLGDQIARMRKAHPNAVPIVELRSAEMPTKSESDHEIMLEEALEHLEDAVGAARDGDGGGLGHHAREGYRVEWEDAFRTILTGESYHPTLVPLAASFAAWGMPEPAADNVLRCLLINSKPQDAERERRHQAELQKLPETISSAYAKFGENKEGKPHEEGPELHWHGEAGAGLDRDWLVDGLLPQTGTGLISGLYVVRAFRTVGLAI